MTDVRDETLAARFAALGGDDDSDWQDVCRRAGRNRRRPLVVFAVAALAVVAAAPAFGLHRDLIDFFRSEPAPPRVQLDFNRMGIGAPPGMSPQVVPDSARKVMERRFDEGAHTLWVAPTRTGGFCYLWTEASGGCASHDAERSRRGAPKLPNGDLEPWLLGATFRSHGDGIVTLVTGGVVDTTIERISAEYSGGDRDDVPLVWVSPPIDAGFYLLEVPERYRSRADHLSAIVATDHNGDVVARQTFRLPSPLDLERPMELPDGTRVSLPAKALAAQARPIIDFESENGTRITLWDVPTTTGVHCYVFERGGRCPPEGPDPTFGRVAMAGGLHGGANPVLWHAEARDDVAAVELEYEDGAVERVSPVEGHVLHEIRARHYPRGHRLRRVTAIAADGTVLQRQDVRTDSGGVYPCEKPKDVGYGVTMCP